MFVSIEIQSRSKMDIIDITAEVQRAVKAQGIEEGICFVFCPHTTAGIILNENYDPTVEQDIATVLAQMVPEGLNYRHGEGNAPSHIRSVLVGSDHFMFVREGRLHLGQWQGVFLAEFDGPRRRRIWIKAVGDLCSG